jgi:hypothetical protein
MLFSPNVGGALSFRKNDPRTTNPHVRRGSRISTGSRREF